MGLAHRTGDHFIPPQRLVADEAGVRDARVAYLDLPRQRALLVLVDAQRPMEAFRSVSVTVRSSRPSWAGDWDER